MTTERPPRQFIPRPEEVHPLGPPPWSGLPPEALRVDLDRVRRALAARGEVRTHRLVEDGPATEQASVLVALFEEDGDTWVVLLRRAAHLRRNAGDVAFPGGRRDPGETVVQAALREAWEEIALDPGAVEVVGELDHLVNLVGIEITPVVGVLPGRPAALEANPDEVDAVLVVPLSELLRADRYRGEQWAPGHLMHEFDLDEDTVWGATARILHQLLSLTLEA